MDNDDFVEKSSQASASHSKGVSRDDGKFAQPLPVTPKKIRAAVNDRASESDKSTAVAELSTETDESVLPSREVTSADEVIPSQSEAATEEDSVLSSPCPGRSEKWEMLKTWMVSRYSMDTILLEITNILKAEMTIAGSVPCDNIFNNDKGDLLFRATNIAGFGRTHVRWSRFPCCDPLRFVTPFLVQNQPRKNTGRTYKLECGYYRKNGCPVEARIKIDGLTASLELNGRHNKDSHKGAKIARITEAQKQALDIVVRTNPLCTARAARRATQNMEEEQKIPPDKLNSVRRNVRKIRKQYYEEKLGMTLSGTYADMEIFAKRLNMALAVRNHNDGVHLLGLHDVHVLSYCLNPDDDLHMTFTTAHNLMNWCRAYNTGLPVCMRMDAAFKLNRFKMCMYFMGFGELCGRYHQWIYSVGSTENRRGYAAAYKARVSSLLMLLNNVKPCRPDKSCELCEVLKKIKAMPAMTTFLSGALCKIERRLIVNHASGDNQDKSGQFVRDELKLPYDTCGAHAGPIMEKNGHNKKHFRAHPVHGTVDELWKKFHKFVKRIMDANTPEQGDFLQQ